MSSADPDAVLLYDPETSFDRLAFKQVDHSLEYVEYEGLVLAVKSKNDESKVFFGRIGAHVAKIKVLCQQRPLFVAANLGDRGITGSTETFVENRLGVMAGPKKYIGELGWQVFVDLESHTATCSAIVITLSFASSAA